MQDHAQRKELASYARDLAARGWVANHDGNVTVRTSSGYLATPTATAKRWIAEPGILALDKVGNVIGQGKAFGELGLHLAVYQRRPDVQAVVHAHPPNATAIACAPHNPIERPFIAEAVVSLGQRIPRIEFAMPGAQAIAVLAPWTELVDAVLLGNHGVITWGATLEQAFLRMELVEHLATIALAAIPLGGVQALPENALEPLLTARTKAGLGRAADLALVNRATLALPITNAPNVPLGDATAGTPRKRVVACAPAPHAHVEVVEQAASTVPTSSATLADLIREEIQAALKR